MSGCLIGFVSLSEPMKFAFFVGRMTSVSSTGSRIQCSAQTFHRCRVIDSQPTLIRAMEPDAIDPFAGRLPTGRAKTRKSRAVCTDIEQTLRFFNCGLRKDAAIGVSAISSATGTFCCFPNATPVANERSASGSFTSKVDSIELISTKTVSDRCARSTNTTTAIPDFRGVSVRT